MTFVVQDLQAQHEELQEQHKELRDASGPQTEQLRDAEAQGRTLRQQLADLEESTSQLKSAASAKFEVFCFIVASAVQHVIQKLLCI